MTVEIPVSADIDLAGLNQKLAQFTRLINQTGEQIARAGRVQFQPITRASLDMARQYEATVKNISRLAPELHKRLQATGQAGMAPHEWQWERLYGDPNQRGRAQRSFFTLATGMDFGARLPTAGGAAPTYSHAMAPSAPGIRQQGIISRLADGIENVARMGGMPGATVATGIHGGRAAAAGAAAGGAGAMGSIGAGMLGGLGAGLGFAAISGIGALMSRVMGAIGDAQQETIGGADLYRRTGGTGLGRSYAGIIAQNRRAARTLDMGFNETQALMGLAARRGNINDTLDLGRTVEQGGGFARAFGFDPSAGVSAFAGLRGIGVTQDTQQTARLGLAIATGIARAGVFGKAEDYLAEIATYGETTARASLQQTNLEGFNAALSSLAGMRLPGLDVRGASNLLQQADASLRAGGAAGEAGQAFLYRTLGTEMGLSPIGAEIMQQGGLFATAGSIFGRGTVAGDYYRASGLGTPDLADDRTNLDRVTAGLQARYGSRPELHAHAMGRLFGTNYAQSMALMALTPEQRRFVGRNLNLSPDQMASMRPDAIGQLGRAAVAGAGDLEAMGAELAGRTGPRALQPGDASALLAARTAARGGSNEAVEQLRQIVARLTAAEGVEETEGDKTRRTLTAIANATQELAGNAVPALNTMRDALLAIAGRAMGLTAAATLRQIQGDLRGAAHDEANAPARARIALEQQQAQADFDAAQAVLDNPQAGPEAHRAAIAAQRDAHARLRAAGDERAGLDADRRAAVGGPPPQGAGQHITGDHLSGTVPQQSRQFAAMIYEAGGGEIPENAAIGMAARAIRESTMRPHAIGDRNHPRGPSVGLLQWRESRRAAFQQLFGKDLLQSTPREQAQFLAWETHGITPPGVDPERAARLHARNSEAPNYRRMAAYAAGRGNTPEAWGNATTHYLIRPANADEEAAHTERDAARVAATPLPAAPGAQATPLPPGAPADAAAAAGQAAGAPVVLQGTVTGELVQRDQAGQPAGPPVAVTGTFGPARPNGAIPAPGQNWPTGRPTPSLPVFR
jgi:hypothetical protein